MRSGHPGSLRQKRSSQTACRLGAPRGARSGSPLCGCASQSDELSHAAAIGVGGGRSARPNSVSTQNAAPA